MSKLSDYKKVFKGDVIKNESRILTFIPTPNDDDYKRGFINRFFVQKTMDKNSPILEVSESVYLKTFSNPNYKVTKLRWRISGPMETNSLDNSVSDSNLIAIRISSNNIKNLKLYLPNLLQFYKK